MEDSFHKQCYLDGANKFVKISKKKRIVKSVTKKIEFKSTLFSLQRV